NNPGPGPGPEPSTGKLEIVLGQGQVTSVGYPTTQPLTIRSLDPSGRPQAGLPITWTVVEGGGALGSASTITDDKGIGTAVFSNFFVQLGVSAVKSVVSATVGSDTVNFIVTTIPNLPNGNRGEAQFFLRKPTDRVIVARAGETLPGAIELGVGSLIGGGVPNIGLRLEAQNTGGPSATCRDGVPLSDNSGTLVCDLIAGPVVGETELKAYVGESGVFTFTLRVEPGVASTLRITGGNNQSGSTGQALQNAFAVQVTDAGGNPLRGATVTWEVVSTGTATVNPATTTTDENGRTSTRVTLGQQPGLVQIRARSGTGTVTFSATAAGAATGLTVTGGGQSAAAGAAFSQPITVTVSNGTTAIPNATVQFSVTQGSATVPPSAVTNSNGVATVNVTAGATPGPVVIRATYGALSQNINLTVNAQGPVFSAASFVSGAGYQPGISPGSIAVINATGIARDIRGSVTPQSIIGPLPTTLAGVEVLFNGVRAPIYSVSNINGQESVIVQVPFETGPGNASVTIRVAGAGETTVSAIPIQAVKPSFFDFVDTNSRRYVVALRPDGSYVTSTNPARRGETVRVFATGLGQTTPLASTNRLGVRDQNVNALVIAGINNEGVRLVSAKMVEGSVGVYVVEMEIPTTATTGDARPIAIGVAGPDGALVYAGGAIPIQ
ncbi:MAG TPA: Ig-like domain-containing protein, partial [Bryobacteraceae bacterium]|nr:Ig-like domain-containing protein [Bryobacteraceae bacterium]